MCDYVDCVAGLRAYQQERIAAMTKLMNRRREQAQIDRKLMGSLDRYQHTARLESTVCRVT